MLISIFTFAESLDIYAILNILRNVDENTKMQNTKVNKRDTKDGSFIPKKLTIEPIKGIDSFMFSEVIIERKGIIDAIEKNSNVPLINNKIINK